MSTESTENTIIPFDFEENCIRAFLDKNGEPRFVGADLARVLEYRDAFNATQSLDNDEKGTDWISTPSGPQEMITVTESGLYSLIFSSRKPEARRFKKWVTAEVLPTLRKTGRYALPGFDSDAPGPDASTILNNIGHITRLIAAIRDTAKKTHYAEAVLAALGFDIFAAQGPAARAVADAIVAYILDNAGRAIPDHTPAKLARLSVRKGDVEQAAKEMGFPLPPSFLSILRGHPAVEHVSYPVQSAILGKQVKCLVLRRPA